MKNYNVLIMGLGLNEGGVAAAKFCYKKGAKVIITDLRKKEELKPSLEKLKGLKIKYVLGKHRKKDFQEADLVIKNPGVSNSSPYLRLAKKIDTDINIFFQNKKGYVIGITGTKGKTSNAYLLYQFLKKKNVFLGGNMGLSPLNFLDKLNKKSITILELSSFALENLSTGPDLAIITNIFPDHLNRYKNFKEYVLAKKRILKKDSQVRILDYDTACLRKEKAFFFSEKNKDVDCYLKNNIVYFKKKKVCCLSQSQYLPAILAAKLLKVSSQKIKRTINNFKGVPYRQEFIRKINGVQYINDSAATTPQSVIKAINKFQPIILIAGGQDKGLDYKGLKKSLKKVKHLILLEGTASDKIDKKNKKYSSMKEAVLKAYSLAEKGDYVVLSPGAASFNLFKNEFDRGDQFKDAVKKL